MLIIITASAFSMRRWGIWGYDFLELFGTLELLDIFFLYIQYIYFFIFNF